METQKSAPSEKIRLCCTCLVIISVCFWVEGGADGIGRVSDVRKSAARAVVVIDPGDIVGETPMDAICGVRSMINEAVRRQRSAQFLH